MARRRIDVDIIANDLASGTFASVRNNASSMTSSLITILGGSVNAVNGFEKSLNSYNTAMRDVNRVASRIARIAGDSVYNFTKDAINNFSELEKQHAKTMGAMATDYAKTAEAQSKFLADSEKLKQQAIQVGTFGVNGKGSLNTVQDVSYAQTALIKSGMSADDILDTNVVESVLKFAGGNDLDVDTATTFAVNLGTVFDKPVEEWGNMLDMVTKAADISVIDVEDIMDSLTYTGGIASGLDRDLEEVLGIISVMGQAGLRGRVAGTGLQAFFTRILSAGELSDTVADSAPTEYVAQAYSAFTAEAVNTDGTFKDMDEVASLLDIAMDSLNDQEQAWFAKKLFGLYQMKAAYAITGAVDGDTNLITDFIDQIKNESSGTNDIKYELMQASQYGKLTSLKNAWEGVKTDFGDRLSPVVSATADELITFLSNSGNYEINWDSLRDAFNESGDLISAKYGDEIGQAVENLGNLGIDAGIIADAMLPYAGGLVNGLSLLFQGDISGALEAFSNGLEKTNENIDDLPPELQGSAEAARNVIVMFSNLAALNVGTKILEIITKAFNTFFGKQGKIISTKTDVNTATSTVQAGTVTSINIGNVATMNVVAQVVNVYGYNGGNNPTNPSTPTYTPTPTLPGGGTPTLPSGGTPTLPSTPSVPTLPSGGGGSLVPWAVAGGGAGAAALGNGASAALGSGAATTGKVIQLYNVGGKFLSAAEIAASAGKMLGLAGVIGSQLFVPGSSMQEDIIYKNVLTEGVEEGLDNDDLRQYLYNNFKDDDKDKEWAVQTYDAQTEMYSKWFTTEGATEALTAIKQELEEQGELSEQFLRALVTNEGSTGGTYTGGQDDLELLLSILFNKEYKTPWVYGGSFANEYTSKFVQGALEDGEVYDLTSLTSAMNDVAINTSDAINGLNNMIDRVNSPNINVNVITNVDKSGNATSNVNINSVSRDIARRASQYGQAVMMN